MDIYPIPGDENPTCDTAITERLRLAKFLTLVLRDDPGAIHLTLDANGWADAGELLARANRYGFELTAENLAEVLTSSSIRHFEWDEAGNRVRIAIN